MVIILLDNGKTLKLDSSEVIIMPIVPDADFRIGDLTTWKSDRAWLACKAGVRIYLGKGEIRTIVSVH